MDVNRLSQRIIQTANTTLQRAQIAMTAGLQTCDEKNAPSDLRNEIRISEPTSPHKGGKTTKEGGETWGKHQFDFSFKLESNAEGGPRLIASAKKTTGSPLSLRCRWKRRVGDTLADIRHNNNIYTISADDIGSQILVEAIPLDPRDNDLGTAFGELGPFEMDLGTRQALEHTLSTGFQRFPVQMSKAQMDDSLLSVDDSNLVLHVSAEDVKVVKPGLLNSGYLREWVGKFQADFPKVSISTDNDRAFTLELGQQATDTLHLNAVARGQRDLIALTIRCMHARHFVSLAALVDQVVNGTASSSGTNILNLLVLTQKLNAEVYRATEREEQSAKERNRAIVEKQALEQDITATIEAYQQIILQHSSGPPGSLDSSSVALDLTHRAAFIADLEFKLQEEQQQKKKYVDELELLRRDLKNAQRKTESNSLWEATVKSMDDTSTVMMLQGQIENLQKINEDLERREKKHIAQYSQLEETTRNVARSLGPDVTLSSTQGLSQTTKLGALYSAKTDSDKDTAKLREENEVLRKTKANLQASLEAVQAENEEVRKTFLYVKEKYDKLKQDFLELQKIKASRDRSETQAVKAQEELGEAQRKIRHLESNFESTQHDLDKTTSDKNRLSKLNESLAKDLDRSRTQLETSSQKLVNANNQLIEEKRSLEKEVEELKRRVDEGAGDSSNSLQQLQEENKLLRSRLRKFATNDS